MDSKMVTVVIPTKDRPCQVIDALRSVFSQSYSQFDVCVVFNNSQEESIKAVNEFVESNGLLEKITIIDIGISKNANVARNSGYEKSRGDYVAFLDSDDLFLPNHLQNAVSLFEADAELGLVYGSFYIDDGETRRMCVASSLEEGYEDCPFAYILGKNSGWAQTSSLVVNKDVVGNIRWDESLSRHQDFDYFLELAKNVKLGCSLEPSVIVNWVRGEKRSIDFGGLFKFCRKWIDEIPPNVLKDYALKMAEFSVSRRSFRGLVFYLGLLCKAYLRIAKRWLAQ